MGGKTTPSAGALYPLELYISLEEGVFHYDPLPHQLERISKDNAKTGLAQAALGQGCVSSAPLIIAISAVYERIERKYGSRGEQYAKIEAGHAAQNIHLQAVALGLGSAPVGAFHDEQVQKVLGLPHDHKVLYLIPAGHPSR